MKLQLGTKLNLGTKLHLGTKLDLGTKLHLGTKMPDMKLSCILFVASLLDQLCKESVSQQSQEESCQVCSVVPLRSAHKPMPCEDSKRMCQSNRIKSNHDHDASILSSGTFRSQIWLPRRIPPHTATCFGLAL